MELTANARPDRAGVGARRAFPFIAAAIAIGLLAAGCGSSSPPGTARPRTVAALEFSKCISSHGVPNLPDPGSSISGPYSSIGGVEIPATVDMLGPAFQAAQRACQGLLICAGASCQVAFSVLWV